MAYSPCRAVISVSGREGSKRALLSAARPAARSAGAPRNEQERLALLRRHQERVREQQEKLDRCPDLIGFKIGIYEDILRGNTDAAEDRAS